LLSPVGEYAPVRVAIGVGVGEPLVRSTQKSVCTPAPPAMPSLPPTAS